MREKQRRGSCVGRQVENVWESWEKEKYMIKIYCMKKYEQ